jgi:CDP-glycerol glycerophosphotransferase
MKTDILISFIVPVYNVEKTLSRCLDSILNQTIKNFEIIIVNDGSRDKSQKIIDKYVKAYPDLIKAYSKENSGPGDARNLGIRNASGQYVAFVDSDDFIESNYVKVVQGIIDEHSPDMVIIGYNRIYNKKQHLFERFHKFHKWDVYNKPIDIAAMPEILCNIEVASWLKIVKWELFLRDDFLFFSNSCIAEDLEVSLKWYLKADSIFVNSDKLYNYVITKNSLNFNNKNIEEFILITESVCDYYKENNKFQECYSELEYLFVKHMLVSNMLRLKMSKHKKNFETFMFLRAVMIKNFPRYTKNKYFGGDPIYLRLAVILSFYFPKIFYLILLPI